MSTNTYCAFWYVIKFRIIFMKKRDPRVNVELEIIFKRSAIVRHIRFDIIYIVSRFKIRDLKFSFYVS